MTRIKLLLFIIILSIFGCATSTQYQSPYPIEQRLLDYVSALDKMKEKGEISEIQYVSLKSEAFSAYDTYKINKQDKEREKLNQVLSGFQNIVEQNQSKAGQIKRYANCRQVGNQFICTGY